MSDTIWAVKRSRWVPGHSSEDMDVLYASEDREKCYLYWSGMRAAFEIAGLLKHYNNHNPDSTLFRYSIGDGFLYRVAVVKMRKKDMHRPTPESAG